MAKAIPKNSILRSNGGACLSPCDPVETIAFLFLRSLGVVVSFCD